MQGSFVHGRNIKFRGKRIDNGQWVYGSLVQWESGPCIHWFDKNYHPQQTWVEARTIGQYTDRKDKNGVEIYEDDIVRRQQYAKTNKGLKPNGQICRLIEWVVIINIAGFSVGDPEVLEVLGNQHDNPGLLVRVKL